MRIPKQENMTTFKNNNFTKRDYEATNIVFVQCESNPDSSKWTEVDQSQLDATTCNHLYTQDGIRYFGWM